MAPALPLLTILLTNKIERRFFFFIIIIPLAPCSLQTHINLIHAHHPHFFFLRIILFLFYC
jgi:hypothetical protein